MDGRCCWGRWRGVSIRERRDHHRSPLAGDALAFLCIRSEELSEQELSEQELSNQERSIAFGARVTFSLRGQRESNQRERPPRLRAFRASCPESSRPGYG